jgi:hypothetical protein
MSGFERAMMDKIEMLERKRKTAIRYCETEEETHRNNVDFRTDKGFQYYTAEMGKIPERREASLVAAQRKNDFFKLQKESTLSRLRADAETLKRKLEQKEAEIEVQQALIESISNIAQKELNDIESKYELQIAEYIEKTNNIKESLSYPSGKMYLKNKELIGILEKEISAARNGMMEIMDQELARKRAAAIAERKREQDEADRKERDERFEALRILRDTKEAELEKKKAKWKLQREERDYLNSLEEDLNSELEK